MARLDPRNRSRYWHSPGIAGVDLLLADFTTHAFAPHVHDSLVLAVTELGGAEFTCRRRTDIATPQRLLVFNPGEPHAGRMGASCRWRYRSFYLADGGLRNVLALAGIEQPRSFASNIVLDGALIADLLALHRAMDERDDLLLQQELLVRSFRRLFAQHGSEHGLRAAAADRKVIGPAVELIRQCYGQRLTLEHLASASGIEAHRLILEFNRAFGLTPHCYLNQVRLRAVLRQLQAGRPVVEAAADCGFYDQSALIRYFKRSFGMTPLQYIRALA